MQLFGPFPFDGAIPAPSPAPPCASPTLPPTAVPPASLPAWRLQAGRAFDLATSPPRPDLVLVQAGAALRGQPRTRRRRNRPVVSMRHPLGPRIGQKPTRRSRRLPRAKTGTPVQGGLRAETTRHTRKPLLLFVFVGLFLLRLAERQFLGLLFHEPPRKTRNAPSAYPLENDTLPNTLLRSPHVSACCACPSQLITLARTLSWSILPSR